MVLPALALLLLSLTAGCTTAARTHESSTPATDRTVHIDQKDFGTEVFVRVGDVLAVARPASYDEWNLAFSTDVLRSLNTEEGRRRPPANGWTFAVVGRGTTDLALTPFAPRGGTPNVPRFLVTVTAQ
jgi:hypothetical protein